MNEFLTIAVCDDERVMREYLKRLVMNQIGGCAVDMFDSGEALLAARREYDICFLDIQMPGINGIETAETLRKKERSKQGKESVVIFVTALSEYMPLAFDVKAFHYLIKPVNEAKFTAVFSRAVKECGKRAGDEYIVVKKGSALQRIFIKDIYYIESRNNKIVVKTVDAASEYYTALRDVENSLGNNLENSLFRCHRCYIVNMAHIKRYNSNTIWLGNGDSIFIARKKYPLFTKAYMSYLKGGGSVRG